jgi:hypothetical protein
MKSKASYEEICQRLGMRADIHFVKITSRGTITFTAGKPDEIRALHAAVLRCGMTPAKSLIAALSR